jgi:hypothetical protein
LPGIFSRLACRLSLNQTTKAKDWQNDLKHGVQRMLTNGKRLSQKAVSFFI